MEKTVQKWGRVGRRSGQNIRHWGLTPPHPFTLRRFLPRLRRAFYCAFDGVCLRSPSTARYHDGPVAALLNRLLWGRPQQRGGLLGSIRRRYGQTNLSDDKPASLRGSKRLFPGRNSSVSGAPTHTKVNVKVFVRPAALP
jgi:hypothetical protein